VYLGIERRGSESGRPPWIDVKRVMIFPMILPREIQQPSETLVSVRPQIPMEFPPSVSLMNKLKGLSREQLQEVLNSQEKQDGLVLDSEEVRGSESAY
ncbi:hypothetical protein scyTo_0023079, partial [Scyliorhinus torazame]|nr:hypothetical protein [Scyliorhinus torazame]